MGRPVGCPGGVDGQPGEADQAGGAAARERRDGRAPDGQAGVQLEGVAQGQELEGTHGHGRPDRLGDTRARVHGSATNEAASQEERPWQAGSQTNVAGFARPDGRPYTTLPEVFVYSEPFDLRRATLSLAEEGPPALIVEVLSDDTWKADLDLERGKPFSYWRGGAAEYLALDPLQQFTGWDGRGWRIAVVIPCQGQGVLNQACPYPLPTMFRMGDHILDQAVGTISTSEIRDHSERAGRHKCLLCSSAKVV